MIPANKKLRYSEIRKEMYNIIDAVLEATLKDLIAEAGIKSFEKNMVFIHKNLEGLSGNEKLAEVQFYSNIKVGNYMIAADVWKDLVFHSSSSSSS